TMFAAPIAPVFLFRRVATILLFVATALTLVAPARAASEAKYEVTTERDVWVPMRDGVKLATDVYHPTANGGAVSEQFPTILQRTPYDKNGDGGIGKFFASRGYVVVIQDTRGRFKSEGVWHMLTDDGNDGSDTCEWIGKQPWSNNRIGMIGTSYVGGTQHA